MLIKASRIRASAGAGALARHLTDGGDNESVAVLRGTVADLHDAVDDAKRFNRVYALRHFIIAPQLAMDSAQFERAAQALGDEFGFDPALALVVEHQKARAVEGSADRHWHLVVPETDAATGRVLSSRFDRARHEKIARLLEMEFAHPIVPGAHDLAVLAALRDEGHDDLADRLASALGHGPKPASAYTSNGHQAAKRHGIDLATVRQHVRAAWADSGDGDDFRARLGAHGLDLAPGEKPGVVVIHDSATGMVLGAANRLAGARRAVFNAFLERTHHDRNQSAAKHRADDLGRHGEPEAGPDHNSGPRTGHGAADAGRIPVRDRSHAGTVANAGEPHGGHGPERRSAPPEARSAGNRHGVAPHDGHGLTSAITKSAATVMALAKTAPPVSAAERSRQHLAAMETRTRAELAAMGVQPETQISSRLHAARLYRDDTHARHAELLKTYRGAQERLAAHPEPRRTMADRLLGRMPAPNGLERLERAVDTARDDLVAAEKAAAGADSHLSRVEKTEAAERGQRLAEVETQRRAGLERLAEIVMAQRVVRSFPLVVYSGPAFVVWAGGKIERKRRSLRNPNARNIWGIPIDFG